MRASAGLVVIKSSVVITVIARRDKILSSLPKHEEVSPECCVYIHQWKMCDRNISTTEQRKRLDPSNMFWGFLEWKAAVNSWSVLDWESDVGSEQMASVGINWCVLRLRVRAGRAVHCGTVCVRMWGPHPLSRFSRRNERYFYWIQLLSRSCGI